MTGIARRAHIDALWGQTAWLPEFDPVLTLVTARGRLGMGPAGSLGQRGIWRVPNLYPSNPPSARREIPCRAHPEQYTDHPPCPHLIVTLQRVVDEVSLPRWMPGPCMGTTPILVRGAGGPHTGAGTSSGGVTHPVRLCHTGGQ